MVNLKKFLKWILDINFKNIDLGVFFHQKIHFLTHFYLSQDI